MEITQEQLDTINNVILSRNTWSGSKNCDYFSTSVWNSVSDSAIKYTSAPWTEKTRVKKCKYNCSAPNFYVPSKDQCFKQVGTGASAYLKKCSSGSYNRYVG